jgi:hypothetical protein
MSARFSGTIGNKSKSDVEKKSKEREEETSRQY